MNSAVFRKTLRDSLATTGLAATGIIAFVVFLVPVMLNMGAEVLEFVSKVDFIRKIFEVTLGIEVEGEISIHILFAVAFTHGTVLMLAWGTLIATTTRVTVGEIERGTADLLLTLPASRLEIFLSTTLAWLIVAGLLSVCPIIGVWIGSQWFATGETVDISRYMVPTLNFFAINVALASLCSLISCVLDRRSIAVGIVVGLVFFSVMLNFLEPFLPWARNLRFFGLLNYYRPIDIVRTGTWPIESVVALSAITIVCWTTAAVIFCRRDIPAA